MCFHVHIYKISLQKYNGNDGSRRSWHTRGHVSVGMQICPALDSGQKNNNIFHIDFPIGKIYGREAVGNCSSHICFIHALIDDNKGKHLDCVKSVFHSHCHRI